MKNVLPALRMFLWLSLLTGIAYPLLITGIAQLTMKHKADGGILDFNGRKAGAHLIAQKFEGKGFFWPRPSFVDYNPMHSGGSNLGPTSEILKKLVEARKIAILQVQNNDSADIPSDLLFASGSGLDPHISRSAARFQTDRIVEARGWDKTIGKEKVMELIEKMTEWRRFGFLGKSYVNVLALNLALEELAKVIESTK